MSVLILSTVIVSVLSAFGICLSALGASRDRMRAFMLLDEKLDENLFGGATAPAVGRFPAPDADFAWQADLSPVERAASGGRLSELTVTVWRDGQPGRYSLATYALEREAAGKTGR